MSGWKFTARREGLNLIVENVRATCFGGSDDPQDSGETASGLSTVKFKWLPAVALPMNTDIASLRGSPIPRCPFGTLVRVVSGEKTFDFPVIDIGPGRRTGNAIDLTIAAARMFDPNATARNFSMTCSYIIINAFKGKP